MNNNKKSPLAPVVVSKQSTNIDQLINMMRTRWNPNVSLDTFKEFEYVNTHTDEITPEILDDSAIFIRYNLLNLYLKYIPSYQVNDDFWYYDASEINGNKDLTRLSIYLKKIVKKYEMDGSKYKVDSSPSLTWNVYSSEYKMYIRLFVSDNTIVLHILGFNNVLEICESHIITFNTSTDTYKINALGPFYTSPRRKAIRKYVNLERYKMGMGMSEIYIHSLFECVKLVKDDNTDDKIINRLYPEPKHSSLEMYVFRKIISDFNNNNKSRAINCFNITSWVNNKHDLPEFIKHLDESDPPTSVTDPEKREYLIIDFNEKEWNYVKNHINKKRLFYKDSEPYDLAQVLRSPRYGQSFKTKFSKDSDDTFTTSYIYDSGSDIARFHISCVIDNDVNVFAIADFRDVSKFKGDNLLQMEVGVYVRGNLPGDLGKLKDKIPSVFFSKEELLSLFTLMIAVYMVLFDRPERSKVVKETSNINPDQNRNPKKKGNTHTAKYDYIIKRVLMPVKEAKEYVAKMSESGKSDREYVLESWERIAHDRRLRNGKIIHIEATTCNRHLPLSNKEIHIKL